MPIDATSPAQTPDAAPPPAAQSPATPATPAPDVAAQIATARQAGYSDGEIASYLENSKTWGPRFDAAQQAGYSQGEILGHLGLGGDAAAKAAGASVSPATDDYDFDVPGGGGDAPPISDATAPTPPAALQEAQNQESGRASLADVPARVGRALIAGWKNTPDILTPQAQDWLTNAEANNPRPNLQDVLTIGHAALAAGNAVFQGGLEGIAALGDAAGMPQLGRDVAGYFEATGAPEMPHLGTVLRSTLPATRAFLTEQTLAANKARGPDISGIMGADSVDAAIAAATKVAQAPGAMPTIGADYPIGWGDMFASSPAEKAAALAAPDTEAVAAPNATPAPVAAATPNTSAGAKAIASAYYKMANDVGGTLTPEFTNKFIDKAESIAPQTREGQAVAGNTPVTELVDRMQALRDEPISLQGAQEIDERLGDMIDAQFGMKGLSKEGHNLLDLQTTFRNMILNAGPSDTTGGAQGFAALKQGRAAWSQAMKLTDLERILNRAEQTDNPATSIKSGIRVLLSNPSRVRGYTPEEINALKDATNRGTLGSVLHVFGSRLIPIGAGAIGLTGGPVSAAIHAGVATGGTALARTAATALQSRRLGNAMSVLGKGVPPAPGQPTP